MESRPPSTESIKAPEEAIFGVFSALHESPHIKIASRVGGRDGFDPQVSGRNHFRGRLFLFVHFLFGRAKRKWTDIVKHLLSKVQL